ncbi:MAG: 4'-phosphopantetheinyl transferase superfamily protein [Ruminococcus sp.]|nr:4'-phosphopantetheinyl transferase superfamily protein [Ruminococcus sp.]
MLIVSLKDIPKKEQHSHAHNLLRECLKKYGIEYDENTVINKNEMGKPSLANYPGIHYNISHADGIASCMIADGECGIDCEKIRPYRPNVIKRAFSGEEKIMLENTPEKERNAMFFRLWTLKESYVKAIGTGISYPLNTVCFSIENGIIRTNIQGYSFRQYIIHEKYVVSLCRSLNHN